jgi:hypothetical protein
MIPTQAACCLISSKPGVANTVAGLYGRLDERVKGPECDAEYSVDYEPSELGRIENYADKLLATAQQKVNESHSSIGHPPIISIFGI